MSEALDQLDDIFTIRPYFDSHAESAYSISVGGYSPLKQDTIMIKSEDVESGYGIRIFNLYSQKRIFFSPYPPDFKPLTACIDSKNGISYTFGERGYISLDLKTQQTKHSNYTNIKQDKLNMYYPASVFVPDFDCIYLMDSSKSGAHYKFDIISNKMEKWNINTNNHIEPFITTIYVPFKQQLLVFLSETNTIFYCDLLKNNTLKLYSSVAPTELSMAGTYELFCCFDHLIFIFNQNQDGVAIWCMDLMFSKSYKVPYTLPWQYFTTYYDVPIYVVKEKNNSVHLLCDDNGLHLTVSLYDLIPEEINISHSQHYNKLIEGYVKNETKQLKIPRIPVALRQLICNYFPCFM